MLTLAWSWVISSRPVVDSTQNVMPLKQVCEETPIFDFSEFLPTQAPKIIVFHLSSNRVWLSSYRECLTQMIKKLPPDKWHKSRVIKGFVWCTNDVSSFYFPELFPDVFCHFLCLKCRLTGVTLTKLNGSNTSYKGVQFELLKGKFQQMFWAAEAMHQDCFERVRSLNNQVWMTLWNFFCY